MPVLHRWADRLDRVTGPRSGRAGRCRHPPIEIGREVRVVAPQRSVEEVGDLAFAAGGEGDLPVLRDRSEDVQHTAHGGAASIPRAEAELDETGEPGGWSERERSVRVGCRGAGELDGGY